MNHEKIMLVLKDEGYEPSFEKETITFEIEHFNMRMSINENEHPDFAPSIILDAVRRMASGPSGMGKAVVRHPATWWDAFKIRWFPRWAINRWPAQVTTHEARRLFPEMRLPPMCGPEFHIFTAVETCPFDYREAKK